jgi:hypothetical protein
MSQRELKGLMQTAYHEAGHAVAAFLMKIRFTGLSIISDDDSFGRMSGSKWTSKFAREHADKKILRSRIEVRMIVLLAGYAAGMIFSGIKRRDGARKDFQDASWLGSYVCGNREEIEAYIKWLTERTKNILSNSINRAAVEALARELLVNKEIGYKKAKAIINASDEEWEREEGIMPWKGPTKPSN